MADVFSIETRSYVMSRIRAKGNRSTELRLVAEFRKSGITGWRRHARLLGNPDFTFGNNRMVVFVDGCFWHGCPRCGNIPCSNRDYWAAKIKGNRARDRRVTRKLTDDGWRVVRVWEHSLSNPKRFMKKLARLLAQRRECAKADVTANDSTTSMHECIREISVRPREIRSNKEKSCKR